MGPFPVVSHKDMRIYKNGLKHQLDATKSVMADDGYTDNSTINGNNANEEGLLEYHRAIRGRHNNVHNDRCKRCHICYYQIGDSCRIAILSGVTTNQEQFTPSSTGGTVLSVRKRTGQEVLHLRSEREAH